MTPRRMSAPKKTRMPTESPSSLGYRMPAEWSPHQATWIVWPQNPRDWPGKFAPIPWVYGEFVRHLAPHEEVRIIVGSAAVEAAARALLERVGAKMSAVHFLRAPTNRGWVRDSGPIFLTKPGAPHLAMDFRFNAWAKYANWSHDDKIPARVAKKLALPRHQAWAGGKRMVLEGGAIDVDGQGTVLTTEECLLSPIQARNPHLDRAGTEKALADHLGIDHVVWLGKGIAGDDTHGHVDDLCRFVAPGRVVLVQEQNPRDPNYRVLKENNERLQGARDARGRRLDVVHLPMPAPIALDGVRLPASYANFLIANDIVLCPTFNDPADAQALGVLGELFPERTVCGIHAVDLVWGLGTLHCMTQQQPAKTNRKRS